MIKKISYATGVDSNRHSFSKKAENKNLVTIPTALSQPEVMNYSLNNLKANYLSFLGAPVFSDDNTKYQEKRTQSHAVVESKNSMLPGGVEEISNTTKAKLIKGRYYSDVADNVAILLGPDKHVLLAHDEQVRPEILAHTFTKNLMDKKYGKTGFYEYNTDVFIFDPNNMNPAAVVKEEESTLLNLINLEKQRPFKEKIVFVKNFDSFLSQINAMGITDIGGFISNHLTKMFPTMRIVGLVPKKDFKKKTTEDILQGDKPKFNVASIKLIPKTELKGMGTKDTKQLLKEDERFVDEVMRRYREVNFKPSQQLIEAIVDFTAYNYAGSNPQKTLDFLDYVASAKAVDMKYKDYKIKDVPLTVADFNRFINNHDNAVKYLKMDDSVFKFSENVTTKMSDVGGMKTAKEEMEDIIKFAKNPKKYLADTGLADAPKGRILAGDPGNGKTLLARAVAGEAGVPFASMSATELLKKYVGEGEEAVREWFKMLNQAAEDSGSHVAIGFIDEIDAIGKVRGGEGGGSEARASILNQLLTELDGFDNKESKNKIIILSATNRDDILDPALKRAGRFDGIINVPNPKTPLERLEILNVHAKNRPFANEAEKAKILEEMAKITEGLSGAELADVMKKAAKHVSRRSENRVITHNDAVEGFLQATFGKISKSDLSESAKAIIVRHEGGHAVLIDTLKQDKVSFITLDGRGDFLGAVFKNKDKYTLSNFKSAIYSAATSYAGGLAEPNYEAIGHSAGVSGDYENATSLIQKAITKWGLGLKTPQISIPDGSPLHEMYKNEIKSDTNVFSKAAQGVARLVVEFHKDFLDDYVKKYQENTGKGGNNLSGDEFSKMRESWIKETGREKQYLKLQNKIEVIVKIAQNSNKSVFKRLLRLV